jgi:hypothetical protein
VEENVRVEDEIFREALGGLGIVAEFGKKQSLFLVGLKNGGAEHSVKFQGLEKPDANGWPENRGKEDGEPLKTSVCIFSMQQPRKHKLWSFF